MSDTYEVCGFCERFAPSSTMGTIYAKDAHGIRTKIRICSRCRSPALTYIQGPPGHLLQWQYNCLDVPEILVATLAIVVIVVSVFFGLIIGAGEGFALMIAGCLLGAGILSLEAASQCGL